MDKHHHQPSSTPVRDAGVALLLCGLGLAGVAWLNAALGGWPVIFLTVAAWCIGIWTAHATITISNHEKGLGR